MKRAATTGEANKMSGADMNTREHEGNRTDSFQVSSGYHLCSVN
jgi:hypothetical protein